MSSKRGQKAIFTQHKHQTYIHTHNHTQYTIDFYVSLRLLRYKNGWKDQKNIPNIGIFGALLFASLKKSFYLGVGRWHSVSIHTHTLETQIALSENVIEYVWMQLRHLNEIRVWNRSILCFETNCQWWWSCPTKYIFIPLNQLLIEIQCHSNWCELWHLSYNEL